MTSDAVTTPSSAAADDIAARLTLLEAENARLRARIEDVPAAPVRERRAGLWRGILSAICIVIASILIPVSIVGGWARAQLVDEERFVATFAPLADDPQVQALIIDETTAAIDENLDLQGITDDLFDGLDNLDLPPRAKAAIGLLRVPAANALTGLVDSTVTRLVQSDAFSTVWAGALRASHRGLVAAATGGTAGGGITISAEGEVGINLGPIIERVKERLVEQGIGFAAAIPAIEATIVVAKSGALATLAVVYNIAVTVGWALPFVSLAFFAAGILLARQRRVAVVGSGIGFALGGLTLAIGLGIGGTVLALSAGTLGVPSSALTAIYTQVIDAMHRTAWIVTLIGVIVAIFAWTQGRSRAAVATRGAVGSVNEGLRTTLDERGVNTGAVGGWLYRYRVLVRVILAILLVIWLLLLRPLGVGEVFLVLIVGLIVWWLLELAQRRQNEAVLVSESTVANGEVAEAVVVEEVIIDETVGGEPVEAVAYEAVIDEPVIDEPIVDDGPTDEPAGDEASDLAPESTVDAADEPPATPSAKKGPKR